MSPTVSHMCCTLSQVFLERIIVDTDKNTLSWRVFQVLRIVEIQKVFTRRERVNNQGGIENTIETYRCMLHLWSLLRAVRGGHLSRVRHVLYVCEHVTRRVNWSHLLFSRNCHKKRKTTISAARSGRRPKLVKNHPFKKAQFSPPSKRTGGLKGTK